MGIYDVLNNIFKKRVHFLAYFIQLHSAKVNGRFVLFDDSL